MTACHLTAAPSSRRVPWTFNGWTAVSDAAVRTPSLCACAQLKRGRSATTRNYSELYLQACLES